MKTQSAYSSKISVTTQQTTRRHNPEHISGYSMNCFEIKCAKLHRHSHYALISRTFAKHHSNCTKWRRLIRRNVLTLLLSVTSSAKLQVIIPCLHGPMQFEKDVTIAPLPSQVIVHHFCLQTAHHDAVSLSRIFGHRTVRMRGTKVEQSPDYRY